MFSSVVKSFALDVIAFRASFTMWMKTYALVPMGISILMQLVVVLAAYCRYYN